jgi:hypothetical protein
MMMQLMWMMSMSTLARWLPQSGLADSISLNCLECRQDNPPWV